ncbi:MAG: hypothetical protein M3Y85_02385, partial [Bacteroidota bacterium]|nr:hypothetical protein [Bacteroidota bacterium]
MQPAICLLSVIPMRKEPSHRSEMVSQVLFGEYVTMGEEQDDFVFATCEYDGYQGWVQSKQLTLIEQKDILRTTIYTANYATPVTRNQTMLQVPFTSPVYRQDGFSFTAAATNFSYLMVAQQTWDSAAQTFNRQTLTAAYQPFINAPYLW